MCDSIKPDLNLWIESFLKQRGFKEYELQLAGNSLKGDGYLGDVTFVKVLTGVCKEKDKIYHLVIKSAKKSEEFRKQTPIKEVFEREMFMYSKVFPALREFQLENGVEHPFMKFAKCYSVFNEDGREALMLQNMKQLHYDIHDRKIPQNLNHCLFVFNSYGRFHAISLAMKRQKPDIFKDLTKNMSDLLATFLIQANMLGSTTDKFKEALEFLKDEDKETYRKLSHFDQDKILNSLCKEKEPSDGISVILHGDCWNNNMMFKYSDPSNKKPSDMVFLDFQLSCVGSPIYDLSYYLYSVADANVLKYHDLLLQTYHHSLTSALEELKETSWDITLEDIRRHWVEYGKFGLFLAPLIVKLELSETDEVIDFAECAEANAISEAFNVKLKNKDAYESRLKSVLKHFASFL